VGGGIRTPEDAERAYDAGADMIVIGSHFEEFPEQMKSFLDLRR